MLRKENYKDEEATKAKTMEMNCMTAAIQKSRPLSVIKDGRRFT
jgi:hypothetical protein